MKLFVGTRSKIMLVILLCMIFGAMPAIAAEETYIYDDNGRLILATGEDGQTVDYIYDNAGNLVQEVRNGARNAVKVCADLAHPKRDNFPDRDVFAFIGRSGELVTVRVIADPPENGMGLKLALTLKDRTVRQAQIVSDISVLPNEVSMILEQDGVYEVEIHGQKQILKDLRYSGSYCVTLEGRPNTAASFIGPEMK